ncbi:MAG: tRNA dihydrouridine synthase DusB [Deltaproteobacteria bacterium CG11_big_fil_rev_8_21_14_0_20_49_13]|nr:MAG: tRNA dihydrouridine synthase DusB [Deltaproteobacteria bacterium CG11_big_fil_rev_8_21_14_0_20_49_13]
MKIGSLKLKNNVIAAPLAGYSDLPWRIIVAKLGAGLVFSEMVASEAVRRAQKKTLKLVVNDPRATPFGVQLFGSKPESFAAAIPILQKLPFDLIDINMGCPVRKVVKRGEGSALMKTPTVAEAIIKAVRAVYSGPLTVKFRSGWDDNSKNAVEIAKIAEGAGADAVIVHPRTREQVFKGHSDWKMTAAVKDAVKIPVIGNGDIVSRETAEQMFKETGCDGIMIGRAAIANPWIFREIQGGPAPTLEEKFALIKRHIELSIRFKEEERHTIAMMRKFLSKYLKGMRGYKELLSELNAATTITKALNSLELFEHAHKNWN